MKIKNETIPDELAKEIDFKVSLKSKQPVVHSTFRLSHKAHDAIKYLSKTQGLKHAEVFDDLLSFLEEEKELPIPFSTDRENVVRMRKTYVVKKGSLVKIKKIAEDKKMPRDLLVEETALFFRLCVLAEISITRKKYRHALETIIKPFWEQAEDIEKKLKEELGPDDPIVSRFGFVIIELEMLFSDIENYIKEDIPIDPSR